jgi:hypothetical protein
MSLLDTLRFLMAGLVIGSLALGGCSDAKDSHDGDAEHTEHMDADDHGDMDMSGGGMSGQDEGEKARVDEYVGILGELMFVPETGDTKLHPKIHHMQIPNFKRQDGTVPTTPDGISGMRSMTMEFPLADGVSIEGFEAGDKIRFSFRVNWGGQIVWEMTGIEKIDAGTEIDFSNVKAEP